MEVGWRRDEKRKNGSMYKKKEQSRRAKKDTKEELKSGKRVEIRYDGQEEERSKKEKREY